MPNRLAVTSADFIRNIGYWQNEALRKPLSITHHGRERLILSAPDAFEADGQRETDQPLRALKADHSALLDHLEECYVEFDASLKIVASNAAAQLFAGRAPDEMRDASVFDVLPQPLASVLSDRLNRVQRARKSERFEASTFDGRHVSVRVFPCADGLGVLFLNMTEQNALRRQIEQSEALSSALATCSAASAIRLDARARIEAADRAFCAWTGFGATDLVGHRFVDLVSAPQRRLVAESIERVMRDRARLELELILMGKRGEELLSLISLSPILTDHLATGAQILAVCAPPASNAA